MAIRDTVLHVLRNKRFAQRPDLICGKCAWVWGATHGNSSATLCRVTRRRRNTTHPSLETLLNRLFTRARSLHSGFLSHYSPRRLIIISTKPMNACAWSLESCVRCVLCALLEQRCFNGRWPEPEKSQRHSGRALRRCSFDSNCVLTTCKPSAE